MKDIVIFGAGCLGREVACYIERINRVEREWNLIGYFDDGIAKGSKNQYGVVLGGIEELNKWETELAVVIAIGSPGIIKSIVGKISNTKVYFPNIIDPSVCFLDRQTVSMGRGNVIGPNSLISCNVETGNFNLKE